ncbi:MAG: thermonuclease [Deltaproteobacteria bacterium]|nr:thermonuclease [Deltaproteobacteria bacterium]
MMSSGRNIGTFFLVVLPTAFIFACQLRDPVRTTVTVTKVVDGDTISVIYRGKRELVRLTGIDAPEEQLNEKAKRDAARSGVDVNLIIVLGRRATRFTRNVVKKRDTVYLEFDEKKRDEYGRLLAYVWLSDGRMLNEVIVSEGYGRVYRIPPNVRYHDRFQAAQNRAKALRKGVWG